MDLSSVFHLEVWWPSSVTDRWALVLKSLLVEVLELLMNHAEMLVSQTECLSVCKAFDSCHLVEENQVVVLDVEVDRVQVLLQNLRIDDVNASLFETHIHDSTQDLEKVLEHVLLGVLVKVLDLVAEWQHELLPLKLDILSGDRGALSALEGLSLQVFLGVRADEVKVHQDVMEANLALTVLVVPLLIRVDRISKLTIHVSQLLGILATTTILVGKIVVLGEVIPADRALPITRIHVVRKLVKHLECVTAFVAATGRWLARFNVVWLSILTLLPFHQVLIVAVLEEAQLLGVQSLILLCKWILHLTLGSEAGVVLVDQIFVHRIELSLEVIDFLLLVVKLMRLLENLLVLFLYSLKLALGLLIDLLHLVLIGHVDLLLDGKDVVLGHRLRVWVGIRHHPWRLLDICLDGSEIVHVGIGVVDLCVDDLKGPRLHLWPPSNIAVAAAVSHFDRFDVGAHRPVHLRIIGWSAHILGIFVTNW